MEEAPAHTSALAVYSNLLAGFGFSGQSEVVPMSGRRVCRLRSRMTSLNASYTYRSLKSERRRSHGVAVAGARTAAAAQKGHGATSVAHVGEAAFHGLSYWNHKGVVCAYRAGSSGRSQFRRIADPAAGIGCRG